MAEDKLGPVAERLAEALAGLYGIEGEIGRGGMGIVYSARDVKLRRRVAIKVLPPELAFRQEIRKRFLREAQTAARLSHPHIVPIHTVGEAQGLVYFIMGYVDGESLAARRDRRCAGAGARDVGHPPRHQTRQHLARGNTSSGDGNGLRDRQGVV
jgi:serine/threonine-protein kinase